jgi:hypothetical protein
VNLCYAFFPIVVRILGPGNFELQNVDQKLSLRMV